MSILLNRPASARNSNNWNSPCVLVLDLASSYFFSSSGLFVLTYRPMTRCQIKRDSITRWTRELASILVFSMLVALRYTV